MTTDVATDDFKAAMTTITQEVDSMARGVGSKISVHVEASCRQHRGEYNSLLFEWSVSFVWDIGKNMQVAAKTDTDLQKAIDGALEQLRKICEQPAPCSICGGRMDGKCYHTHEEPEPIAPDAPTREVNEVAAMAHMAEAIDLISDASNRPETVIYTEREHPDDERDGAGPS